MKTLVASLQDRLVAVLTRALVTVRHQPPGLHTPARVRFLVQSLFSALFIACVIHAWPVLVLPVDLPLRVIIGNVVSWTALPAPPPGQTHRASAPLRDFALIKLDDKRFRRSYLGNSPLDRCTLLQDLSGVLASSTLQLLAIDLDLSPSTQRALLTGPEDPRSCDARLDQLMIDNARRVLLILPLDRHRLRTHARTAEATERAAQQSWLAKMKDRQVKFARPELDLQFGIVRHHLLQQEPQPKPDLTPTPEPKRRPEPGLGVATAQAICALDQAEPSLTHYCAAVQALNEADEGAARQISLHVLVNDWPLQNQLLLDGQTGTVLDNQKIRYALLGASYSPDDEPLTPIGRLAGVEVHAAIAANPNEAAWHGLDLALDVLFGVVFAYGVHAFWRRYFGQRLAYTAQQTNTLGHPLLAYRWLVGLVGMCLALLPLLGWVSAWALAQHGLWISPAGMLVGSLIDAFVIGGVHTAEHLLHDAADAAAAPAAGSGEAAPTASPTPTPALTPTHLPAPPPAQPDPAAHPAAHPAAAQPAAAHPTTDSAAYWQGHRGLVRRGLAWLPSLVWLAVLVQAFRHLAH